jgi:hypothetical protein
MTDIQTQHPICRDCRRRLEDIPGFTRAVADYNDEEGTDLSFVEVLNAIYFGQIPDQCQGCFAKSIGVPFNENP